MKSIFAQMQEVSRTEKHCRVLRPSGWGGGYKRKPASGYHKQMKLADMKLLAFKLEHGL